MKDIFLNKKLRTGGFYELAIQVCPNIDNEPIKLYTEFIWKLENAKGPFDIDFNLIEIDIKNNSHNGVLLIDNYTIPFLTYNIREDNLIDSGFNWFDICFYTAAIEEIFGDEYVTWAENPKSPIEIDEFMKFLVKNLYNIFPFQLAIIDFEASGRFYLNDLKNKIDLMWNHPIFYVGKENYEQIAQENKPLCNIIEEM